MTEYRRVFLDTAPLIYILDTGTIYMHILEKIFEVLIEQEAKLYTSVVSVEEYLVYPYRNNDNEKIKRFFSFIDTVQICVLDIDKETAKKAAEFRSKYIGFKGMDAMQLASAFFSNADVFLTNDKQLCQCEEVNCIMVEDFINMIENKK